MLVNEVIVLSDVLVVEIRYPEIEKDIQQEGEIENSKVHPVGFCAHRLLNGSVNTQNPERLNKQVQRQQ